ncbi:MAG: type I restriction endonuclease subunit S, partial [Pedobacter sp.]
MTGLPDGWEEVPLGKVCQFNPREIGDIGAETPISFIPMPSVSDSLGIITEHLERPFSAVSKGYTRFMNGDVIFAKITPCMENGKIAIAKNLLNGAACGSTEFHVLRP